MNALQGQYDNRFDKTLSKETCSYILPYLILRILIFVLPYYMYKKVLWDLYVIETHRNKLKQRMRLTPETL